MVTDLTEGNIKSVLWKFSIPMLCSAAFQQLYNISDTMIAGKFAGEDALAAIGASYPITMIFMAIAIGCNIGCSVVISQYFGAKKLKEMKLAIKTSFVSSVILSGILTIVGILISRFMLILISTPNNILNDGCTYLKIYIGGFVFVFLYNVCTGIFNAIGDSKTPLVLLIFSSVGNIVLDILFIAKFKWGVAGAAFATFIAQGVAAILAIVILVFRLSKIKCEKDRRVFSIKMFKRISIIAIPSILQQSFISIGNLFIQNLINGFGSAAVAGYAAAIKLNTFLITCITTLSNGISSFAAQNLGANKLERIEEGFKVALKMAMIIVVPFFIAYFAFPNIMMNLFLDSSSSKALEVGRKFLMIVSPFYFVLSLKLICDGVFRGVGAMVYFMASTFSDFIVRIILAYILSSFFGTTGIWMAWPFGWIVATFISAGMYFKGAWKNQNNKVIN